MCSLRLLFWAAVVGTLTMALLAHPPHLMPIDKREHKLAYAVVTLLAAVAYPAIRPRYQVAAVRRRSGHRRPGPRVPSVC